MFWKEIWSFCGIQGEIPESDEEDTILEDYKFMDDFPKWFKNRKLNFAKNLLYPSGLVDQDSIVIHFRSEIDSLSRSLSWKELRIQVAKAQKILKVKFGVKMGDRIAAYAPNCPEVLVYMLAGASIGAIFTAGSPDFGPTAIVDRFSQTKPKILLSCNAVYYNGKIHSHYEKLGEVVKLCSDSLEKVLLLDYIKDYKRENNEKYLDWDNLMAEEAEDIEAIFENFDFDTPLYIVYSSGTTGKPKCIVHGAGGSLIQHLKEHLLHGSVEPGHVMMQYTTIGWMMWQWLVSGLAAGATLVLYDGSPFRPDPSRLWQLAEELKVTHFGASAKYLQSLQDTQFTLSRGLKDLKVIFSTGSPLPADTFKYVYQKVIKDSNVQLASITGGTDILSLFAGGCPILPVYAGEIQAPCLGMALACDEPTKGIIQPDLSLKTENCGDLVCIKPFPSQPVSFWLDDPVKREKYRAAYFSSPTCPRVWHHGDFLCFREGTGGLLMLGRSDGTLNPAGVRFGSADLYAICGNENNSKWIADSVAVGVKLDQWKDEQVFLFLVLKDGSCEIIPEDLLNDLRNQIKTQLSPRHVPAHIHPAPAIPHTLNGKKVEVSVKRILNGDFDLEVVNLANPESIDFFRDFAKNLQEGKHFHNNNKL
jgi:acetoacetyl-CoA synthetase